MACNDGHGRHRRCQSRPCLMHTPFASCTHGHCPALLGLRFSHVFIMSECFHCGLRRNTCSGAVRPAAGGVALQVWPGSRLLRQARAPVLLMAQSDQHKALAPHVSVQLCQRHAGSVTKKWWQSHADNASTCPDCGGCCLACRHVGASAHAKTYCGVALLCWHADIQLCEGASTVQTGTAARTMAPASDTKTDRTAGQHLT